MPGKVITNSPDVAFLDDIIYFNTCTGVLSADLYPTQWIDAGKTLVKGAKMQVLNPQGVIVKDYPTNYEIAPGLSGGMDSPIFFAIPTISNGYQLGKYTVNVQLTDQDNNQDVVSKEVVLCAPDQAHPTLKFGNLSARMLGNCQDGKLAIIVDTPPNYKGATVYQQTNSFTLDYPTASQIDPLNFTQTNVSVQLYEGVYLLSGTICAVYNLTDNVFVSVLYKIKKEHDQKCIIDLCCVYAQLEYLNAKLKTDCSTKEKEETTNTVLDALRLLRTAELAAHCGEDPSEYISDLEKLLGCKCTCNCNEGTPIINNAPTADAVITGCNVQKQTVGLTTYYTINNYEYKVDITDNGGALTMSAPTLLDCTYTTQLSFNIGKVYDQILSIAQTNACDWAAVIRRCLNIDLSCLGLTEAQVDAMTFNQILQAIANGNCSGAVCPSKITNIRYEQVGRFIVLKWDEDAFVDSVEIYANGILQDTIAAGIMVYDYPADGQDVTIAIVPKCANGAVGSGDTINISNILRPPFIAPPQIYSQYLKAACPYDITTNVLPLPLGISSEFHRLNNTSADSLVPDPTNVLQGVYWVFGKDSNGFYSDGTQMQLTCDASGSCSEPQNITVVPIIGGNMVQFQSAAYPPPLNSYTVKRRLKSDADLPANYTTIGNPVWNPSASRWVINDMTAVANTLYVYRAISNCGTTTPYVDQQFANITCPVLTLTPKVNEIDYSFVPVGGQISKYEVSIYEDAGYTLVHTNTHIVPVSNPQTGQFLYLDPNKTYFVRMKLFIEGYSKECPLQNMTTLKDSATLSVDYIGGKWIVTTDNPLASDVELKVANVTGYTDACVTPSGQTDTVGPNIVLAAGTLSATQTKNGLTYISTYYKLTNSVDFEVYGTKVDGDTIDVNGATVTIRIKEITCQFYPA